jgi:hypothetical protein
VTGILPGVLLTAIGAGFAWLRPRFPDRRGDHGGRGSHRADRVALGRRPARAGTARPPSDEVPVTNLEPAIGD